jgi:hypothetical protein
MAIENLDARIGHYEAVTTSDGTVSKKQVLPELDINGLPYLHVASTAGLDRERFVVLPVNFKDWGLLEAVKKQLGIGAKAAPAVRAAKAEAGSDGE